MNYRAQAFKTRDSNQLWEHDNHYIELSSPDFIQQKVDYIHQNPVKAGWVYRPGDYIYSSAANYAGVDQIIAVDCIY